MTAEKSEKKSRNLYPTIRLRSHLYQQLGEPYGARATVALDRYFWVIQASTPDFSEAEWNYLKDACASWTPTTQPVETLAEGLVRQVENAIKKRLGERQGVDAEGLLAQLRGFTPIQLLAVIQEIEEEG